MKIYQNDFQDINLIKFGCYYLCLFEIAKKETGNEYTFKEIYDYYKAFVNDKTLSKTCYVIEPTKILKALTGKKWNVEKSTEIKNCDYIVANVITKYQTNHFILVDKNKQILYDSDRNIENTQYKFQDYRLYRKII